MIALLFRVYDATCDEVVDNDDSDGLVVDDDSGNLVVAADSDSLG